MIMKSNQNIDVIEAPELHENTRSGRATWDERGNTVWEWQTAPGIYSKEISTQQLRVLQAKELQLVDQPPGITSTYSHWKRQYPDRFTRMPANPVRSSELVMPVRRKMSSSKSGLFDRFLKGLGLPD